MKGNAKSSLINISVLLPLHILQILINFIAKTAFIKTLGPDYLGINVLFGDITTLLSLTELGLNNAIMFSLYLPLSTNDHTKISAILNYSKNIFNRIAIGIMLIGLAIIPGLKYVVNSELNMGAIVWYYILYLITVAVTYLSTYKTTLISADEKNYIVKIYYTAFNALRAFIQIFFLFATHNFTLYLLIGIISNLMFNLAITIKVNKEYPYIDKTAKLKEKDKKDLFKNTKAVFKNKIAGLVLNNTDNIIISTFLNTALVGKYSGYTTLYTTLIGLMNNFYSGVVHSIGKLNTSEKANEKHHMFNLLHTVIFLLASIVSSCFYLLADDFIKLWIGPEYLMAKSVLVAIVINFYIAIIFFPVEIYKQTTKLFVKVQNIVIITTISNIVLSIILSQFWGLTGILIATGLSKFLTIFWSEPYLLFKCYFNCDKKDFILYVLKIILEVLFTILVILIVSGPIKYIDATTWSGLFLKGFTCLFLVTGLICSGMTFSSTYRRLLVAILNIRKRKK